MTTDKADENRNVTLKELDDMKKSIVSDIGKLINDLGNDLGEKIDGVSERVAELEDINSIRNLASALRPVDQELARLTGSFDKVRYSDRPKGFKSIGGSHTKNLSPYTNN